MTTAVETRVIKTMSSMYILIFLCIHTFSPIQADVKINKTDLNDHVKNLNTLLDIVEPNHPISFRPQIDYVDVLTFAQN